MSNAKCDTTMGFTAYDFLYVALHPYRVRKKMEIGMGESKKDWS